MASRPFSSYIRRGLSFLLSLALLCPFFPIPSAQAAGTSLSVSFQASVYPGRARAGLSAINKLRKNKDLPPLVMLADLEKAATQRAAETFVFFDHDRPDLSHYSTVMADFPALKGSSLVGESLATGFSAASGMVAFLQKDKEHLANLLSEDFTHVGIACVQVPGSFNGYYWVLLFAQYRDGTKAAQAKDSLADSKKNVTVSIARGMYSRGDRSHGGFELRVSNINMKQKRTAQPSVTLYDRYGVKIGKCDIGQGLTYTSGDRAVFTVLKNGTLTRKKTGSATLTVKAQGLPAATCTVTVGSGSASTSGSGSNRGVYPNRTAVTAATIGEAKPGLTATTYSAHVTLSSYVKGASGYVLYRSASKDGTYRSVDEKATTQRLNYKLETGDGKGTQYYYKVRAYKNSNGQRVYSAYSAPVKVSQ